MLLANIFDPQNAPTQTDAQDEMLAALPWHVRGSPRPPPPQLQTQDPGHRRAGKILTEALRIRPSRSEPMHAWLLCAGSGIRPWLAPGLHQVVSKHHEE